jgi:hypothetical protein
MKSQTIVLALALWVVAAGTGWGQAFGGGGSREGPGPSPKKPAVKSALELALEQALTANPDLRVAEAKLAEADAKLAEAKAQLSRARMQLIHNVVTQYRAQDQARAEVRVAEDRLARLRQLHKSGSVSITAVQEAESALGQAKAKLASADAAMAYLLGKSGRTEVDLETKAGSSATLLGYYRAVRPLALAGVYRGREPLLVKGPMADKIRKALDQPVTLRLSEASLYDVIETLKKANPGIHIHLNKGRSFGGKVTVNLTSIPFGAALQLLEDAAVGHRIVVREYGLLITPRESVPPGAMLLGDFWKGAVGREGKGEGRGTRSSGKK